MYIFLAIYLFSFCKGGNQAYGEIECPDAKESDQGAYSCEAINIKGFCFHKYLPANLFSYIYFIIIVSCLFTFLHFL